MTAISSDLTAAGTDRIDAQRKPGLLLNDREVVEFLGGGVSTRSVWRWVARRLFPQPIRLGGRTLWKKRDIERFVLEADGCLKKFNRIRRGEI